VIAASIQCFAGAQSCVASRLTEGEPYEFARTSSGWVTHALAPPASRFEPDSYWHARIVRRHRDGVVQRAELG
jgi:hypothetical protein